MLCVPGVELWDKIEVYRGHRGEVQESTMIFIVAVLFDGARVFFVAVFFEGAY